MIILSYGLKPPTTVDENEHWGNKDYKSIQEPLYKVPSYYYLHLDRGDAILFGGSVRV